MTGFCSTHHHAWHHPLGAAEASLAWQRVKAMPLTQASWVPNVLGGHLVGACLYVVCGLREFRNLYVTSHTGSTGDCPSGRGHHSSSPQYLDTTEHTSCTMGENGSWHRRWSWPPDMFLFMSMSMTAA